MGEGLQLSKAAQTLKVSPLIALHALMLGDLALTSTLADAWETESNSFFGNARIAKVFAEEIRQKLAVHASSGKVVPALLIGRRAEEKAFRRLLCDVLACTGVGIRESLQSA